MHPLPDFLSSPVREALQEAYAVLRDRYGARLRHVVLYGSQARADAHDESDIDVLVVLDEPVRRYDELKRLVDVSMNLFNRFGYWISFKVMPVISYDSPTCANKSASSAGAIQKPASSRNCFIAARSEGTRPSR